MTNPMTMVERAAKAIYEGRNGAGCKPWAHLTRSHQGEYLGDARAAIAEMKYEDGTDESDFIDAAASERLDPVSLICAYDRVIDSALSEHQTQTRKG